MGSQAGNLGQSRKAEQVRSMFAEIAPRYDFLNHTLSLNIDRRWRRLVIKAVAEQLDRPDAAALDLCCGTGDLSLELGAHARTIGVDFCHPMLRLGMNKIRDHADAIELIEGDALNVPFSDSTFDVVTFWSALEHTSEPSANLRQARRIIKSGGSLIIQLPNAASYQARVFGGEWFALDAPRHRYHFTLSVLNRLLSETGFEVYRVTYFSKAHNAHALRQSLKSKLLSDDSSFISNALFYLSVPFVKPFDGLMSVLGKGATLTVAAYAV